jgi:hypothetical protein
MIVVSSDDGLAPANAAFASALGKAGNSKVTEVHLATDHSYSDQRPALSEALRRWLAALSL